MPTSFNPALSRLNPLRLLASRADASDAVQVLNAGAAADPPDRFERQIPESAPDSTNQDLPDTTRNSAIPSVDFQTLENKYQVSSKPFVISLHAELDAESGKKMNSDLIVAERWYKGPDGKIDPKKVAAKPVQLHINSPGGDIYELFNLLDRIDHLKSLGITVESYTGFAASAAAVIASSATPGHRFISPNGTFMIHQSTIITPAGSAQHIQQSELYVKHIKLLNQRAIDRLYENSGGKISKEQLSKDLIYDHFMTADDAIRYGLMDHVGVLSLPPDVKKTDEQETADEADSLPETAATPENTDENETTSVDNKTQA